MKRACQLSFNAEQCRFRGLCYFLLHMLFSYQQKEVVLMKTSPTSPFSNIIDFLSEPSWTTAAFWLLLITSIGVAAYNLKRDRSQRAVTQVWNWLARPGYRGDVVAAVALEYLDDAPSVLGDIRQVLKPIRTSLRTCGSQARSRCRARYSRLRRLPARGPSS
jgi:hypothetical protein